MITKIINGIIKLRKFMAIKKANRLAALTKKKHLVFKNGFRFKIFTKSEIRLLVRKKKFRKGLTAYDIEQKAIHIAI